MAAPKELLRTFLGILDDLVTDGYQVVGRWRRGKKLKLRNSSRNFEMGAARH